MICINVAALPVLRYFTGILIEIPVYLNNNVFSYYYPLKKQSTTYNNN